MALFAEGGASDLFKRLYEEPWRFLHLSEHQNEVRAAQKQRAQTQSGDVSLRSRLILDEKHALGLKDLLQLRVPPELVVLYAADPDNTDLADQCAATLAPLENAGAVRLRFIASERLDAPESKRSFAAATLLVILVNAQLFDTKAALDELALLLPRSEAQGVHVLVVLDGDSGVDFPGSDDRIVQLTSSGSTRAAFDRRKWQLLTDRIELLLAGDAFPSGGAPDEQPQKTPSSGVWQQIEEAVLTSHSS